MNSSNPSPPSTTRSTTTSAVATTTTISSATTSATTSADVNSQFPMPDNPQPPSESTSTSETHLLNPNPNPNPSPAAKLPSRPSKLRKLSPDTSSATAITTATTTTSSKSNKLAVAAANNKLAIVSQARSPRNPKILSRSLSSDGEIEAALKHLRNSDPHLARLIDLHQPPTFDSFQTPFLALTKSILYQQLAYKAGTSIYSRFVALCGGEGGVSPETVLSLTAQQLRQIGVSGRKTSYLHDLARKYQNGILSDSAIINMDDKSLFTMLTMVNGIGSWSVHMFMIFSLHRPDVLPVNDLGVRKGVQLLYGLEELPRPSQMDQLCEKWRPYRSVASWYLWRFVESKGTPSTLAAVTANSVGNNGMGLQQQQMPELQQQQQEQQMQVLQTQSVQHHQQQQQTQHQPQYIDPMNSIVNLGYCFSSIC